MKRPRAVFQGKKWLVIAGRHARFIAGGLFAAIVLVSLCAGLWPFLPPRNHAEWVPGKNAIRFVRYGTAFSRDIVKFPNPSSRACTIELLLKPRTPWTRGTPLAFYNREHGTSFEIQQVYADLRVVQVSGTSGSDWQSRELEIPDVFLKPEFLLTIASDGQQTQVYVNGRLLLTSSSVPVSSSDLSGRVILGNAPVRNHQWTGEVKGLAVYGEQLSAQLIGSHSTQWTAEAAPTLESPGKPLALYLFREREGRIVHDTGSSGADLEIPAKYVTVDQMRFERPSSEAHDANFRHDAIFNIYGFMPLGFTGALFFGSIWKKGRSAVVVIAIGLAVSLTIEFGQSFLPTRFSGMTDLVTNTLGTALGVLLCYCIRWIAKEIWAEHVDAQPR